MALLLDVAMHMGCICSKANSDRFGIHNREHRGGHVVRAAEMRKEYLFELGFRLQSSGELGPGTKTPARVSGQMTVVRALESQMS